MKVKQCIKNLQKFAKLEEKSHFRFKRFINKDKEDLANRVAEKNGWKKSRYELVDNYAYCLAALEMIHESMKLSDSSMNTLHDSMKQSKPKETTMRKPIFESEEEMFSFLKDISCEYKSKPSEIDNTNIIRIMLVDSQSVGLAKKKGYIEQSELEKAKGKWLDLVNKGNHCLPGVAIIFEVFDNYMNLLEAENQRLKNEKS